MVLEPTGVAFWPRHRFWVFGVQFCVLRLEVGPLRVNSGHLEDDFWTIGSLFWASESQFRSFGGCFLDCERRTSTLFFEFEASGSPFLLSRSQVGNSWSRY